MSTESWFVHSEKHEVILLKKGDKDVLGRTLPSVNPLTIEMRPFTSIQGLWEVLVQLESKEL